jgi:hypothetical protein
MMTSTRRSSIISTADLSISRFSPELTIVKILPASQAASCAPLMTSPANGVEAISSVIKPMA